MKCVTYGVVPLCSPRRKGYPSYWDSALGLGFARNGPLRFACERRVLSGREGVDENMECLPDAARPLPRQCGSRHGARDPICRRFL